MLDKKWLRDNPEEARQRLAQRGAAFAAQVDEFVANDETRRKTQVELDQLKNESNAASKQIGALMKEGKTPEADRAKDDVRKLKLRIAELDEIFSGCDERERELLLTMPNVTHPSVPEGGEDQAKLIGTTGEPRRFDFAPLDHVALCQRLELVNFEAGTRLAGGGFPVMAGQGALLQRALINFMLDLHVGEHGYTEMRPPFIVHPRCPLGTGQLPKFGSEMYHVYIEGAPAPDDAAAGPHYYLIPTAEVPVCNLYRDTILEAPVLPVKVCAYSPCWRVEAGSYGKEARGLTRVHQFEKVELVRFADPATSWDELEEMTSEAERVLERLGLAFRRIVLPTGDMAFGSAKTYDVEVYCPAEQKWREVSSASNTTDYQARRMNMRYRPAKGDKPVFPHILNASGVALPRLVIALIETHQTADGTVRLPEVLHKYMPEGLTELKPPVGGVPFV
ncbi:serine--tRNA ligase [bacterium]|nr:serine--tRNA ligase [bacterium]